MSKQLTTKQILDYTEAQQTGDNLRTGDVMILDVGKSLRKDAKMSPKKRRLFLETLSKSFNITKACQTVGISYQGFHYLKSNDEVFNKAYLQVREAYLHQMQQVSFQVACDPTHKGYNDRRLQLQAFMPDRYNPKQEIEVKHTVTDDTYLPEIRRILSQYVSSRDGAVEAKYTKCNDNNELEER